MKLLYVDGLAKFMIRGIFTLHLLLSGNSRCLVNDTPSIVQTCQYPRVMVLLCVCQP